jgi:hypothetical protein
MQNQIIGIRLPPDLIDKAEELTTQLQKTDVSDFGGTITRSATMRRALRLGLAELESQINGVNHGQ